MARVEVGVQRDRAAASDGRGPDAGVGQPLGALKGDAARAVRARGPVGLGELEVARDQGIRGRVGRGRRGGLRVDRVAGGHAGALMGGGGRRRRDERAREQQENCQTTSKHPCCRVERGAGGEAPRPVNPGGRRSGNPFRTRVIGRDARYLKSHLLSLRWHRGRLPAAGGGVAKRAEEVLRLVRQHERCRASGLPGGRRARSRGDAPRHALAARARLRVARDGRALQDTRDRRRRVVRDL